MLPWMKVEPRLSNCHRRRWDQVLQIRKRTLRVRDVAELDRRVKDDAERAQRVGIEIERRGCFLQAPLKSCRVASSRALPARPVLLWR